MPISILAIETSCDETAVAIIEGDLRKTKIRVLTNLVSSQIKIHKKWGGIVPGLAKREHQRILVPLLKQGLKQAGKLKKGNQALTSPKKRKIKEFLSKDNLLFKRLITFLEKYQSPDLDYIAVTTGPGLEPALWTGINLARSLAFIWEIPLLAVNHIEAHIFANFLKTSPDKIFWPALVLIVSGGHTQLILMPKLFKYKIIGETRDDAAGECFDKTGRLLGIDYPAGPKISKLAEKGDEKAFDFPRPMLNSPDLDFSFSGLKTAVFYFLRDKNKLFIQKYKNDLAASIQKAIIDVLVSKTLKSAQRFKPKTLILGGGVVANKKLQKEIKKNFQERFPEIKILLPRPDLNTDNALMVALNGFYRVKYRKVKKISLEKIQALANWQIDS